MTFLDLFIMAFASARLTYMLMHEDGPFMIFERIRNKVNIYNDALIETDNYNFFGNMLICSYCTSMYTSIFTVVLFALGLQFVNVVFALSAVVILFLSYYERLE